MNDLTEFTSVIEKALHLWNNPSESTPLTDLMIFKNAYCSALSSVRVRVVSNRVLDDGVQMLAQSDRRLAELLWRRFRDDLPRKDVARIMQISIPYVDRLQRAAIGHLAELLYAQEMQARAAAQQQVSQNELRLLHRLDLFTTYDRLFGVEEALDELSEHLRKDAAPFVIAVEGIGGIGKTSLAIESLRHVAKLGEFDRIAFVTAQQQQLLASGAHRQLTQTASTPDTIIEALAEQLLTPEEMPVPASAPNLLVRMQQVLRQQRGLVVVDNLETISALDALMPALHALAAPSKVLVTTREQPQSAQPVYRIILNELTEAVALRFLRHQAEVANVGQLQHAGDVDLAGIYALTGGNPLALRLVVGQCDSHPLQQVLADLQQVQGRVADHLYTYIYRRAWDLLDGPARRVLVAMLIVPPHGGDLALICSLSGMAAADVGESLTQLVRRNLVNYHSANLQSGVYSIHSLTRTFLHRQVLRWM
jgi:hypothetical protein